MTWIRRPSSGEPAGELTAGEKAIIFVVSFPRDDTLVGLDELPGDPGLVGDQEDGLCQADLLELALQL